MVEYFGSSDVQVLFKNHPGDFSGEIDAAHFVLTAGEGPIHIWNYARRASDYVPESIQAGSKGGALFDDTALSSHMCQLQLVLNMDRFKSAEYAFAAMTRIGDVVIRYRKAAAWDEFSEAGYTLVDGYVAQVGKEITVRNAIYPTITLHFKRCVPFGTPVPLFEAPGVDAAVPETAEGQIYTTQAYNLQVKIGSFPRTYHPDWYDLMQREQTSLLKGVLPAPDVQEIIATRPEAYVEKLSFQGALIELRAGGERILFAWHPYVGYRPVRRQAESEGPILPSILGRQLHEELEDILLPEGTVLPPDATGDAGAADFSNPANSALLAVLF